MSRDEPQADTPAVNPGYAAHQLAKALRTGESHPDEATRERALNKAAKWTKVLDGVRRSPP